MRNTLLKIKEKAGIETAKNELKYRKQHKEILPLTGLQNTVLYLVQTEKIILLDAFHSATIEGARTTVENVRKAYEKPKSKAVAADVLK